MSEIQKKWAIPFTQCIIGGLFAGIFSAFFFTIVAKFTNQPPFGPIKLAESAFALVFFVTALLQTRRLKGGLMFSEAVVSGIVLVLVWSTLSTAATYFWLSLDNGDLINKYIYYASQETKRNKDIIEANYGKGSVETLINEIKNVTTWGIVKAEWVKKTQMGIAVLPFVAIFFRKKSEN